MSVSTLAKRPPELAPSVTLPEAPSDQEKASYLERHRSFMTCVIVIGNLSILASQVFLEVRFKIWVLVPYTLFNFVFFITSLPNRGGVDFDHVNHERLVREWQPGTYPSVDIHLPVCGEPLHILRNTWAYVFELIEAYPGLARAYVLDDADNPEARELADDFGFAYVVRENRGWMKKAGNLRNAYDQTEGVFIVILDADFVPRTDFLAETLPYFYDDPKIAVVQTPQYFRTTPQQTWIERSAGAVQEMFYRFIQVSRDSYGASICVGSCAVYRREALDRVGGPTLIEHSEDVHTGFDLQNAGWKLRYIPVVLSTGACPSDAESFLTQQYRWCEGSMSFLGARKFWGAKMSKIARLCFISGFCYYIFTAIELLVTPLIPSLLLIVIPGEIKPAGYLLLLPGFAADLIFYPFWHRSRYGPSIWALIIIRSWSHTLALWDIIRGRHMGWQPTGGGGRKSKVRRFWVGVATWNGGAALLWLGLAAWRIDEYGPARFWVITGFGVLYAAIICQVLSSHKRKHVRAWQ